MVKPHVDLLVLNRYFCSKLAGIPSDHRACEILGRNSRHMSALGLSLHIRHTTEDVRRRFGIA